MKLVSEWHTHELTYRYENEMQKELHIGTMERDGYTVVPGHRLPIFMRVDALTVIYEKRVLNDRIPRL